MLRTGDLAVTAKGLAVFERISQMHADAYYLMKRANESCDRRAPDATADDTLYADLASEADQYEALALELRAPDGTAIRTEEIWVRDTEFLQSIADECDEEEAAVMGQVKPIGAEDQSLIEELLAELEEDNPRWVSDGLEREPVRFQVHIRLRDECAIP
jgi:hypothetical protein